MAVDKKKGACSRARSLYPSRMVSSCIQGVMLQRSVKASFAGCVKSREAMVPPEGRSNSARFSGRSSLFKSPRIGWAEACGRENCNPAASPLCPFVQVRGQICRNCLNYRHVRTSKSPGHLPGDGGLDAKLPASGPALRRATKMSESILTFPLGERLFFKEKGKVAAGCGHHLSAS